MRPAWHSLYRLQLRLGRGLGPVQVLSSGGEQGSSTEQERPWPVVIYSLVQSG